MNELLECPICNNQYDNQSFIPKFIECGHGHTICLSCCKGIYDKHQKQQIQCPFDNEVVQVSPRKMQTNLIVLQMLDNVNFTEQKCIQHNEAKIIYCKDCGTQICYKCVLYFDHKNHDVAEVKDIYQEFFQQATSIYDQIQSQKNILQEQMKEYEQQKQKLKSQVMQYQEDVEQTFQFLITHLQSVKEQKLKEIKEESDKIINSFIDANMALQKRILQMMNIQQPIKGKNGESGNIEILVKFLQDSSTKELAEKINLPQVSYNFKSNINKDQLAKEISSNLFSFQLSVGFKQDLSNQKTERSESQTSRTQKRKDSVKKQSTSSEPLAQSSQKSPNQFNKGYQLIEKIKLKQQQLQLKGQKDIKQQQKNVKPNLHPNTPNRRQIKNNKTQIIQTVQKNVIEKKEQQDSLQSSFLSSETFDSPNADFQVQKSYTQSTDFKNSSKLSKTSELLIFDQDNKQKNVPNKQNNAQNIKFANTTARSLFSIDLVLQESFSSNQFLPGEVLQLIWIVKNTGNKKLPASTKLVKHLEKDTQQKQYEYFCIGELEPKRSTEVYVIIEMPYNVDCYNYEFQIVIDQIKIGKTQIFKANVTKDFLLISDKQYSKHFNFYVSLEDKKPFKLLFDKKNVECFWNIYDEGWCQKFDVADIIKYVIVAEGNFQNCQSDLKQKYLKSKNESIHNDKVSKSTDPDCHIY